MKRSNASQSAVSKSKLQSSQSSQSIKSTKSGKKNSSSKNAKSESKNNVSTLWILIGIAIVGIIFAIILFWSSTPKQDSSDVLVRVNDMPITKTDFGFQYNLLPETYKSSFSQDQVLEQIIDEELVVQAAKKEGNNVTLQEVNERIQKILASTGISLVDLQKNLDGYNISQEQFELLVHRQLLIERYLKDKLVQVPIDDAMTRAEYESSKDKYVIAEQVTVKHVLIAAQQTDAAILAKQIYDDARAGKDFCELVINFSNDKGSKDTCGEYTFPKGFMVPEFEQASFDMKSGEVRLVQTQFGYHIILKINDTPASIKSYESVKPIIADELQSVARAKQYRDILTTLRASATIRYQNGTVIAPAQVPSIGAAKEQPVKLDVPAAPSTPGTPTEPVVSVPEQVPVVPSAPSEPAVQETQGTITAPTATTVVDGKTVEVQPEQNVVAPDVPIQQSAPADGIDLLTVEKLICISGKSTLYGMPWSSDTQSAQNIFAR